MASYPIETLLFVQPINARVLNDYNLTPEQPVLLVQNFKDSTFNIKKFKSKPQQSNTPKFGSVNNSAVVFFVLSILNGC